MKALDLLAFLFVAVLVFGPIIGLVVYSFRRGRRAFAERLDEVVGRSQARNTVLRTSFKAAIFPALMSLFGGIRVRASRGMDGDPELGWQCVTAIGLILVVFVILPFVIGVQTSYLKTTSE